MDHKEQHHEHHRKEREEQKREQKEYERRHEQDRWPFHPAWLVLVGAVLVLVALAIWSFFFA